MNRREFIYTTGAAATAAALPLANAQPAARRIRIGFLGGEHSHGLEKWKTLAASPDYELVGIAEASASVRAAYEKLGAKILSEAELLERCEVIAVESAVRGHARHAQLALAAGKHVHVEKPPAATMREFEEQVRIAREKKLLLQMGYMWRFNPGIDRIIEAVNKGWLGEVFLVRAQMNSFIDARRRPEWGEFRGGAMFELGCHLIDAVVRLLGKPTKVTPHLQRRGPDDLADNCTAILEFPKAQAIVTSAVLQPNAFPHRFFEVIGTNGMARTQPLEPPTLTVDLAKAAGPYKAGPQSVPLPAYRRYAPEFVELAEAIRQKRPLATSFGTDLLVQQTLLKACDMM